MRHREHYAGKIGEARRSIDIVFSLATLEHLHRPELFLAELNRVLKPGGVLLVTVPNIEFSKSEFWDNPGHRKPFTRKSLGSLIELFGFEVVALYPGLRCKPKWMYGGRYSFFLAAHLPLRKNYEAGPLVPFSGRARSIAAVALKPIP